MIWESSKFPFFAGFCQTEKHHELIIPASYEETMTVIATDKQVTEIMAWRTCESCHDEMVAEYAKEMIIEKCRSNSQNN